MEGHSRGGTAGQTTTLGLDAGTTAQARGKEMKFVIRSQEQLQEKIDRHLRSIALAHSTFWDGEDTGRRMGKPSTWGSMRAVYDAIRKAGYPVDYLYVAGAMGLPLDNGHKWRVATRMTQLFKRGFLRKAGRGEPRYRTHGAQLFVAVEPEDVPIVRRRIERAIARMIAEVEPYAQLVNDVPACMARRIEQVGWMPDLRFGRAAPAERDAEIIKLRLSGVKLDVIGAKFGITRERVRQIVERAVTGGKRREYKRFSRRTVRYDDAQRALRSITALGRYPKERKILLDVSNAILKMGSHRYVKDEQPDMSGKQRMTKVPGPEQWALDLIRKQTGQRMS